MSIQARGNTGVVSIDSDLVRQRWMMEGMLQEKAYSKFNAFIGSSKNSIVYRVGNEGATDGHTVVFDFHGNLSGSASRGNQTAFGRGETIRKFSDTVTVERFRLMVNNGTAFDAKNIGDLSLHEHSTARYLLSDLYTRWVDQAIFDTLQGSIGTAPTHIIDLGANFGWDALINLVERVGTGDYTTGGRRRPLMSYNMRNRGSDYMGMSDENYVLMIDERMASTLKQDSKYQNLLSNADVRGNMNRLIKGYLGTLGSLMIIEAKNFYGTQNKGRLRLEDTNVDVCGLRTFDTVNNAWTGASNWDGNNQQRSRGLLLGQCAIQLAYGRYPDYKFQMSEDFGINSESAVEFWFQPKKTVLTAENSDYTDAKVADIDYGLVAIDATI